MILLKNKIKTTKMNNEHKVITTSPLLILEIISLIKSIIIFIVKILSTSVLLILMNVIALLFYIISNFKIPTWELIKDFNECSIYEDSPCGQFVNEKYYYTFVHKAFKYKSYKKNFSWGNLNTTHTDINHG